MALFGKPASISNIGLQPSSPNWRAPSKFGLNNSTPVFVAVSAKGTANSNSSPHISSRKSVDQAKERHAGSAKDEDDVGVDVAEPKGSPNAYPTHSLTSESKDLKDDKDDGEDSKGREEKDDQDMKEVQRQPMDEGGQEEDDESDYEDDDDEEEEDELDEHGEPKRKITMSLNLMRALGLDTTGKNIP